MQILALLIRDAQVLDDRQRIVGEQRDRQEKGSARRERARNPDAAPNQSFAQSFGGE